MIWLTLQGTVLLFINKLSQNSVKESLLFVQKESCGKQEPAVNITCRSHNYPSSYFLMIRSNF